MFKVDSIEKRAEDAQREVRWFPCTGKVFGDQSPTPLKMQVRAGGEKWNRAWTAGMQEYAKGLPSGKRRRFNQNAQNPMTIDAEALVAANRAAIRESGVLVAVAACGPIVEFLDQPLPPDVGKAYAFSDGVLPEALRALYRRRADGWYEIPVQTAPPEVLLLDAGDVDRLLKFPDFVNQVAEFRRQLVDEDAEGEEEELGNSASGSAPADAGQS